MSATTRTITLRDLVDAYLESLRPQLHPIMTDHVEKTVVAFEAALRVKVPRDLADVPETASALFMLFSATIASVVTLRSPLSTFLEAGLIFRRLDDAGDEGRAIRELLDHAAESERGLRETQSAILERLLVVFLGGARPTATMDQVRATGLYPGDTPKDFDIFDHM